MKVFSAKPRCFPKWKLVLTFVVCAMSMMFGAPREARAAGKALILGSTVTGGLTSPEAVAAAALGLTVEVDDDPTWAAKSTADFQSYQVIILGDPDCTVGDFPLNAAVANQNVWGPAVNGNVIVIGTDPEYHDFEGIPGALSLINDGVSFAGAQTGKTGLYVSLSCYYAESPANTPVPVLNAVGGGFTVIGLNGAGLCFNVAHIVATSPALNGLSDSDLSNWSCSVHEATQTWPPTFEVLAIAEGFGSVYTATDGTIGTPYILSRGATVISSISLTPASSNDSVGGTQQLTASVVSSGSPVVGTKVTFQVIAGPDNGKTGTGTTDSTGKTTFNLTNSPAAAGEDFINASFVDSLGHTETSGNVTVTWAAGDKTPPSCSLTGVLSGPPKQIQITAQDGGSGLNTIVVTQSTNATTPVPSFTVGTNSPVVVTATKTNQSETSHVTLKVTDVAGNTTTCDPVDMTVSSRSSGATSQTLNNLPYREHFVVVSNGNPGVNRVELLVNGTPFQVKLSNANSSTVDVSSAMRPGLANHITAWAYGATGGSAYIVVHD